MHHREMPTRPSAAQERDHFARLAARYDGLRPLDQNWEEMLARLVDEAQLAGRGVLEVGTGTGRLAVALTERYACSAVATDPSAEMLAVGQSRTHDIRFEQAIAEQLPFQAQTFERVVTYMAVHLFDRPRAFGEFHRVLTTDGIAAISTPDPDSFAGFVWATYFPSYADADRARFPSAESLLDELATAGFRSPRVVRLHQQKSTTREEALARIRERAFSTFQFIGDDEFEAGLRQAEETMPPQVSYPVVWLIALGRKAEDGT
jgi:ubiquinone/menaquinone biosynthesis C-methylase UbiE